MKFIVTLHGGETHTVDAHSFEPGAEVVTFHNDTRTPIAAFSGWISVKPEQPQEA